MTSRFSALRTTLLSQAAHVFERHPRQITALIATILLGGGGGAFAVASLGPDAAKLPVREVLEAVESLPIQAQADAMDATGLRLYRSEQTRASDSVETLLARLGISDAPAAAYLRSDTTLRTQVMGRAGRNVTVEATQLHALQRLTVRWTPTDDGTFRRLVIERTPGGGFASRVETAPLTASTRLGSGTIRTSLFAAVDEARISDDVAVQIADVFDSAIDFHRGLRRGDRFNVVYEALEADGEPMRTGRVLSVEFVNNGKTHQAMWFQEAGRKGSYYTLDGKSLSSFYLASPMEFSRVTSGFAMRMHPIQQRWKAHLGVDYGAPTGTPVRSVGEGVVDFAGVQNGFGNVVIVRHNGSDTTLYAHLSRFNVKVGQKITQGQHVGAVGSTGWATGPHLHFEFRVNDVHQDPLLVAQRSQAMQLSSAARPTFDRLAQSMRLQLTSVGSSTTASAE